MSHTLQKDIDLVIDQLIQTLNSVDESKINVVPFEGSWTAGQVAQHMIMSNSGFADLINGRVKDTERRPDEHVETIRRIFLDFSTKMDSPDFVCPPKIDYNKEELLHSLQEVRQKLYETLQSQDMTKTCTDFELPQLGHLTRIEAAHFVLVHTQRHIRQLSNIIIKLKENSRFATA